MSYRITHNGVLLHSTNPNPTNAKANVNDDRTVQVCAMGNTNTVQPVLPLYGKVSNKCALDQESTTSLMFNQVSTTDAADAGNTYPPSYELIKEQFQTLLLQNKKRSIHIVGDSHQRYMYAGLVDLANHNCSNVYINPAFMAKHHLLKQDIQKWFSADDGLTNMGIPVLTSITSTSTVGQWPQQQPRINIRTDNYGFYNYNETLYNMIQDLSSCIDCIIVMNVGIHDMTTHTYKEYMMGTHQYGAANAAPNVVPKKLNDKDVEKQNGDDVYESLYRMHKECVTQFMQYVQHLKMEKRFVWVSGTPYVASDTFWVNEAEEEQEKKQEEQETKKATTILQQLLVDNKKKKQELEKKENSITVHGVHGGNQRATKELSRFYRSFLYEKQLCDAMNIKFLDIFHPLSGGGNHVRFDSLINGGGDIHKKRYVWRTKASILLKYLSEEYAEADAAEHAAEENS